MDFSDKWLVCEDCGHDFLWDAGEQAWYHSKQLENQPKHCKQCRDRRRDARIHLPREYSKINCEHCGTPAYVPFVPRGIKPVYCRSCMSLARA